MAIIEHCIPKGVLPKKRKLSWINAGVRHAIRKRNIIYCKSRSNPNLRARYKQLHNKVISQLRSAKRSYVQSIPAGNSKQFWKSAKWLNGKGAPTIPVINHDGKRIICDKQKADALNQFFHSCFNTATPPLTSEEGSSYGLDPAACPQELYCSEQEIYELLVNLDSKKASGPDGISARMIKETASSSYYPSSYQALQSVYTNWRTTSSMEIIKHCTNSQGTMQIAMNYPTTDRYHRYPSQAKCWKRSCCMIPYKFKGTAMPIYNIWH